MADGRVASDVAGFDLSDFFRSHAYGVVPPGILGHRTASKYSFNPDEARALLKEVGISDLSLELKTLPDQQYTVAAQVIQSNLADVGIKVQIIPVDSGPFWNLGLEKKGDDWKTLQLWIMRYRCSPDPSDAIVIHYSGYAPGLERIVTMVRERIRSNRDAGVTTLAGIYHACHRELCSHERVWPLAVVNFLDLVGESMGLQSPGQFKRLKIVQDVDAILNETEPLIESNSIDMDEARSVNLGDMIGEQALPLGRGG